MAAGGYPHAEAARGRIEAPCRRLVPFQLVLKQVGSNKLERHLFDPEPNGASEIWFGVEQIVFRLEPNESTFCPLNGSRPDESIRSALDYGDLSETFACAFGQSSWNGTRRSIHQSCATSCATTIRLGYSNDVQRSRAPTLRASPQLRRSAWRNQHCERHKPCMRRRLAPGGAHRERPNCRRTIPHARMQGGNCQRFAPDRADHRQDNRGDSRHYCRANLPGARRIAGRDSPWQSIGGRRAGRDPRATLRAIKAAAADQKAMLELR